MLVCGSGNGRPEGNGIDARSAYASQVMDAVKEPLEEFRKKLPPGYEMQITGIAASAQDGNSG